VTSVGVCSRHRCDRNTTPWGKRRRRDELLNLDDHITITILSFLFHQAKAKFRAQTDDDGEAGIRTADPSPVRVISRGGRGSSSTTAARRPRCCIDPRRHSQHSQRSYRPSQPSSCFVGDEDSNIAPKPLVHHPGRPRERGARYVARGKGDEIQIGGVFLVEELLSSVRGHIAKSPTNSRLSATFVRPGERSFDIYSRLLRERIICVHGYVGACVEGVAMPMATTTQTEPPASSRLRFLS